MKKDFEYLEARFESEGVKAPDSLNEEAVMSKLGEAPKTEFVPLKQKRHWLRGTVAVAACFAVIAVSAFYFGTGNKKQYVMPAAVGAKLEGIETYDSYEALKKAVGEQSQIFAITKNFTVSDATANESSDGATAKSEGEGGFGSNARSDSFATTNRQVDAVDESDIVKTDGSYIYYVSDEINAPISVFSAKDGKTERVAKIEPEAENAMFYELYIYGDKLIALGSRYAMTVNEEGDEIESGSYTFVNTYDMSDRRHPQLTDSYEQSGGYNTSRMIGSCVYLVTYYGGYYAQRNGDFVPCATGEDGTIKKLDIADICGVKGSSGNSYGVIGAIDVKKGKAARKTKAIFGVNQQVYCNEKNLYLTGTYYKDDTEYTRIVKYSLDKTNIEALASGEAKGSVNDQFSMDEKDGNLRIALTDYRWGAGKDRNYLYVLDKNLELLGETEGFAKNEHIEAARFIGDTAYVITYKQTDPLFIIDLSNPEAPQITGEVKIDGFSAFLTPVDENTLLGVGYATKEEEWGTVQDGLKLALFDVSNQKEPRVLDEFELHDSDSEAQFNHKALVVNREQGYFAIPFQTYTRRVLMDGVYYNSGALVIRIKHQKLEVENLPADRYIRRCTYIGDYLYLPDTDGEQVYAFRTDTSNINKDLYPVENIIEIARCYIEDETAYDAADFEEVSCELKEKYTAGDKTYQQIYVVNYSQGEDVAGGDMTVLVDSNTLEVIDAFPGE